jgi:hypothetical protein
VVTRSPVVGLLSVAMLSATTAGCARMPVEPLKLEGNLLTVDNRTAREWTHVEIWLNTYYRVTADSIPPGGHFTAPLDTFVEGFGRRFDYRRTQITALRLNAKLPDGRPLELNKEFYVGGLAGALKGIR